MQRLSDVDIAIQVDKEFYSAGQQVQGRIFIQAHKQYSCARIVLEIQGMQTNEFTLLNEPVKGNNRLINTRVILKQYPHNYCIQGQFQFPFNLRLQRHLPGSFKEEKEYKAQIAYYIKLSIQPNLKEVQSIQKKIEIIIRQPQQQTQPGQKLLQGETFANIKSCFPCCTDRGVSRITCYFQKNYYSPQDICELTCEIDNSKCQLAVSDVSCKLFKKVTLTAIGGRDRTFLEELRTLSFPGIQAEKYYFGQTKMVRVIPLTRQNSMEQLPPSTNGGFVTCQYYVNVECHFAGSCFNTALEKDFNVKLIILQQEIPIGWRGSIQDPLDIFLDFSSTNDLMSSMCRFGSHN